VAVLSNKVSVIERERERGSERGSEGFHGEIIL